MSSEVVSEPAGPRFGPYILTALLGRGGMGVVYKAYDTVKGRTVALKVLIPELAADRAFQDRFRRESKRVARLNEPHVIPIHDFGQIDGRLFIDMRLVEGTDLATILNRDGPMPPRAAAWIISQVASALDAAHADGLIHRDIKPSNVLITGHGQSMPFAYLIDFGIARVVNTSQSTGSGTIGTVAYMAPERITGLPGDRRTDVYSLACVLYECLTGRPPFVGEMVAVMWAQLNVPPPIPTTVRSGLPTAVDEVIARGLAKDPGHRYAAAGELAEAILAATADPGVTPAPPPADQEPSERSEHRSSGASSAEAAPARESGAPPVQGVPLWESDPRGQAGTALRAIVSNPDLGIAALSSAQAMSVALKDLLPEMPRETAVLVAAAEVGLAKAVSYHVARGVDLPAVRAAAVKSFANHTGFRPAACGWAVDELIAVLGLDPSSAGAAR
jgi:serine/threonine protein kinase